MLAKKIWQIADKKPGVQSVLARELKISPILAQILANRGITTISEAQLFLTSELSQMHHPMEMLGIDRAVARILEALQKEEQVIIYGDYDVDGVTSTSVLLWLFRSIGLKVDYYIPDRITEGYGPNCQAFRKLRDQGAQLIVTVDSGISAVKEVELANDIGLDVIITDHHEPPDVLPPAYAIVNPKQKECTYPFKNLAGVGVAFKLGQAVLSAVYPAEPWWNLGSGVLDLVCLGTVADIVPLQGENRILVKHGLAALGVSNKPGLQALMQVCGLQDKAVNAGHVGFMLAPRLNAAGRLGDAKVGVQLLTTQDFDAAMEVAQHLNRENEERQAIELEIFNEAVQIMDSEYDLADNPVIVLGSPKWHPGVIGIVASRLVEKYYRPTILMGFDGESAKGSCRSIAGLDMYEALKDCHHLLVKYGGHRQAAGLSMMQSNIPAFRERINKYAKQVLQPADYIPKISLDGEIHYQLLNLRLVEEMELLAPFGYRNPEPVLACRGAEVLDCRGVGKEGAHLKLRVKGGGGVWDAIGFRMGQAVEPLNDRPQIDLAVALEKNEWNGRVNLQFNLKDIKLCSIADNPFGESVNTESSSFLDKLFDSAEECLEDDYYRGIDEKEEFFTKVVGVTFDNRQETIGRLKEGETLLLIREPANRYDPNAISVDTNNGEQIGYLNARLAKHLALALDRGEEYVVVVTSVTGGTDKNYGVNLSLVKENLRDEAEKMAELAVKREELSHLDDIALINEIRLALLGANDYRDKQWEAIQALMQGQRILAIFGTGRGKSAVFQSVAAYKALREQKVTIIIYPLRALVNDQYEAMQNKLGRLGLRVFRANGSISDKERVEFFQALEQKEVDVLLTTPEFLEYHMQKFNIIKQRVGLFVADESHHIGKAGSNRPAYGRLGKLIGQLGSPPVAAVTATADDEVAQAIINTLAIERVIIDPHIRTNLEIVDSRDCADKPKYLRELIKAGGKTIIYVNSRQQTIDLARYLREVSPEFMDVIAFYNAGLTSEQRSTVERLFREGVLRVVVTTSAFGEGIDIPDVENVVLYHLNFNFTEFNQQSGRGGRDGRTAKIHLLFGSKDIKINDFILESTAPGRDALGKLYLILKELAQASNQLQITNAELAEMLQAKGVWAARDNTVSTGLSILEEVGLVERELLGRQRYLSVNPPPSERLDLNKSLRYTEGLHEKAEFTQFQQQVFAAQPDSLLNKINQPIFPRQFVVTGENCN